MSSNSAYTISPLGDSGLIIGFGNRFDDTVYDEVLSAYRQINESGWDFIIDIIPAYSSVGLMYDPLRVAEIEGNGTAFFKLSRLIDGLLTGKDIRKPPEKRIRMVPVCYEEDFAPDIGTLAASKGLTTSEVIQIHSCGRYTVYMLGFLPGFAYMGMVDDRIAAPRRASPRTEVPKGSVGIAGTQTGIYPVRSPGGWQLIGRTPIELFDSSLNSPTFFQPGDEVIFYPITANEFKNY